MKDILNSTHAHFGAKQDQALTHLQELLKATPNLTLSHGSAMASQASSLEELSKQLQALHEFTVGFKNASLLNEKELLNLVQNMQMELSAHEIKVENTVHNMAAQDHQFSLNFGKFHDGQQEHQAWVKKSINAIGFATGEGKLEALVQKVLANDARLHATNMYIIHLARHWGIQLNPKMPPHQVQPPPLKTPEAQTTSGDGQAEAGDGQPKADSTPDAGAKSQEALRVPRDTSTPPPKSVSLVGTAPAPARQNPPDMMALMAQMQQMH